MDEEEEEVRCVEEVIVNEEGGTGETGTVRRGRRREREEKSGLRGFGRRVEKQAKKKRKRNRRMLNVENLMLLNVVTGGIVGNQRKNGNAARLDSNEKFKRSVDEYSKCLTKLYIELKDILFLRCSWQMGGQDVTTSSAV